MRRPPTTLAALLALEAYENIDPAEWALIREWLTVHGGPYDRIGCNVRLGPGRAVEPSDSDATQRMWTAITSRRADLVVWQPFGVTIAEAKVHAGFVTVTQLLDYVRRFRLEVGGAPLVTPVIICRDVTLGVARVMAAKGGRVDVFERRRGYERDDDRDRPTDALGCGRPDPARRRDDRDGDCSVAPPDDGERRRAGADVAGAPVEPGAKL